MYVAKCSGILIITPSVDIAIAEGSCLVPFLVMIGYCLDKSKHLYINKPS